MLALSTTEPALSEAGPTMDVQDAVADGLGGVVVGHATSDDEQLVAAQAPGDVPRAQGRGAHDADHRQQGAHAQPREHAPAQRRLHEHRRPAG